MHENADVAGRDEAPDDVFTYRSARSGSLFAGLALALLVETVVLHLWIVGRRFVLRTPRDQVARATQPDWRDIPEGGTPAAADYVNPMKPAAPNVLVALVQSVRVRVAGGFRRTVRRIGLHVDEPQRLIRKLDPTEAPA